MWGTIRANGLIWKLNSVGDSKKIWGCGLKPESGSHEERDCAACRDLDCFPQRLGIIWPFMAAALWASTKRRRTNQLSNNRSFIFYKNWLTHVKCLPHVNSFSAISMTAGHGIYGVPFLASQAVGLPIAFTRSTWREWASLYPLTAPTSALILAVRALNRMYELCVSCLAISCTRCRRHTATLYANWNRYCIPCKNTWHLKIIYNYS